MPLLCTFIFMGQTLRNLYTRTHLYIGQTKGHLYTYIYVYTNFYTRKNNSAAEEVFTFSVLKYKMKVVADALP